MPSFTCISCRVAFADGDVQRAHYKSDWHRYNLKRKVAEMPPVTAEAFREKVLAQKAESNALAEEKNQKHCDVCNKLFSSENAFANHLHSRKHKEHEAKSKNDASKPENEVAIRNKKNSNSSNTEAEDVESDGEYEEADDESLETTQCLFCPHFSITFEDSMRHMTKSHSFYIPDLQYVTDLEALIGYLGEKVGLGKVCLYCNGKGKEFHSIEAVQKHMTDKGHCKIYYEGDDILEFSDFYDFSSSYPDAEHGDDNASSESEVSLPESALTVSETTGELCLPSGAKIGHRSLRRYYQQQLRPEQVKHNEIVVRGLMTDYKLLGWSGNIGEANRLKIQHLNMKNKTQRRRELKLNMKANKFQPHFREQVRY
jgi:pre-60S factor REI1